MKVYILFSGSGYPNNDGNIVGVFLQRIDADNSLNAEKSSDAFIEEHEVIE